MNIAFSKISGLTIFLLLIFFVLLGCSDNKTEKNKSSETKKALIESQKKGVEFKIDLLCLKYGLSSEPLKKDLKDYVMSKDRLLIFISDTKDTKMSIEELMKNEIEIDALVQMSNKHNVTIQTIAGLFYDYMIWKELENKCEQ